MKFSEHWLREFCNPKLTSQALIDRLTMAGLEVEAALPVAATSINKVVVGEVQKVKQHPNADKLQLCQVSDGAQDYQVVCGADNVHEGMKAALALPGAQLLDAQGSQLKVKKTRLRGQESEGMLCSERELGLGDDHQGLMTLPADAPLGKGLQELLALDDQVIDLDLTPNRGDCLSILGLGRETALISDTEPSPHFKQMSAVSPVPATIEDTLPVELADGEACPVFAGRVIRGVNPSATTPLWLREKLRRSDIRAIDPLVDVTNYVMLELGQPLHAYDCKLLAPPIIVRRSRPGEKLRLLDGSDIDLAPETLLITDQSGPIGMAGIMGGLSTAVTAKTVDIYLESAFFSPLAIAGRARGYGMATDASHRFERGVDWRGQTRAIERATRLLLDIAGGQAGPVVETVNAAALPEASKIQLRSSRINLLLGVDIATSQVEQSLARLGFDYRQVDSQAARDKPDSSQLACWEVQVPSHRFDIAIEADLIEEISRVYGYNNLPTRTPATRLDMAARPETQLSINRIKDHLAVRGYHEAITYSFVDAGLQAQLNPDAAALPLANPLSADMSVMRTTLWAGLLKSLMHNLNRHQNRVKLFEIGLAFQRLAGQPESQASQASQALTMADIAQVKMLSGLASGSRQAESWANDKAMLDFFDIKGDLESLLALTGEATEFRQASHPALHPGQSAEIVRRGERLGIMGLLTPQLQQQLDIRFPVFLFEIDTSLLLPKPLNQSLPLSPYPMVRRDLALLVARDVSAAQIGASVEQAADEKLIHFKLFDVYEGEGIEHNKKSIALGLTFQHSSRTLVDEEVSKATSEILLSLEKNLGAELR